MSDVSMLDMSAIIVMEVIVSSLQKQGTGLVINNLKPPLILKLKRVGIRKKEGQMGFSRNIYDAIEVAKAGLLPADRVSGTG